MNILITGASGFIGSYLSVFFSNKGYRVIATARDITKIPTLDGPGLATLPLDVLNVDEFDNFELPAIDAIIHTATSNDIISKNPKQGILLSACGTRNLLEFCLKMGIPKLIFFSTFQVYGTELNGTIDEHSPLKAQNDYSLNHIFGEQYMEMYSREKGISGIIVRPANVYGRFSTESIDRWTLVPGCFCREIKETGKIILKSSGKQTRNFVNLENIGRALDKILEIRETGFDIYNIGGSGNFSMLQVAEKVLAIYNKRYGRQGKIEIMNDNPASSNSFVVDLQKLYSIGFEESADHNLDSAINEIFIYLEKYKTT